MTGSSSEGLVARTAHLFAARTPSEGAAPLSGSPPPLVLRRLDRAPSDAPPVPRMAAPGATPGAENSRDDMQELVDRVVEALEQRVVDELERRGRRNRRGGF